MLEILRISEHSGGLGDENLMRCSAYWVAAMWRRGNAGLEGRARNRGKTGRKEQRGEDAFRGLSRKKNIRGNACSGNEKCEIQVSARDWTALGAAYRFQAPEVNQRKGEPRRRGGD